MEPAGALESWTEPAGALESWTEPAGALESWTEPAGALESWTEPAGALESWTEPAGALESWTEPAGALESWTEPAGALESWTEPAGALESWTEPAGALEGTGEVQALEGTGEVQALEGTGEVQAPEGTGEVQAPEGTGEEQAPEGAGEEQAPENLKPPQGWTGPAGTTEEGEGASHTPTQSPSQLNPPPCPAVPGVLSAPSPPWCRGRSSTPHSHRPRQAPSWWALSPALAPDLTGWAGPAATKMSWAEPVETPAGLREPRMVRGLRWPRMVADLPQTTGWTSRRRRRRFPANGEHGRAAAGGGPLPREQNQETKTFKNGRKTKPGGSGTEVTVFSGPVFCQGCTGGSRNEETWKFVQTLYLQIRRSRET